MKNIILINNFCRDFSINDNGRFMFLCKELSKENNVEIITNDFDHGLKKHKPTLNNIWPFKITFLHEKGYKKNVCLKRFYSHFFWGLEVYKYLNKINKPDVVYCNVPSLTAAYMAGKYCKKNKIKFIIDIQDLWPEGFKMLFNVPVISDFLFYPFSVLANKIYKSADIICAVSQTYIDRAIKVNKNCTSTHAVYIGTSVETYENGASKEPVIKKNKNELWLGYAGSLSSSYDIPCVIDSLKLLKGKTNNIPKFIIMGNGALKESFEEYAKSNNVDIYFTGRLPYDQMCAVLNQCDIVINPIKKNSAASIINKHGDYACSGLPVINTQESPEYQKLILEYNMGFNCKNGDSKEVSEKLLYLIQNKKERIQMGKNAKKCAYEKFDRVNTYKELVKCIVE